MQVQAWDSHQGSRISRRQPHPVTRWSKKEPIGHVPPYLDTRHDHLRTFEFEHFGDVRLVLLKETKQGNRHCMDSARKVMQEVCQHLRILVHDLEQAAMLSK